MPATPIAAKTPHLFWEDFPVGQRREFGAMPVLRDAVLEFARQFDPQPFHLDEAAAHESLFGGLCASGWHTAAMAMRMMCDGYLLDSSSLGSPGLEAIRWVKPVFPGDTLSVQMEVLQARPMASRPQVGLVRFRWTVLNQHRDPVLTMEGWNMFGRREVAAPGSVNAAAPGSARTSAPAAAPASAPTSVPAAAPTVTGDGAAGDNLQSPSAGA